MYHSGIVRNIPGGLGIAGKTIRFVRHVDGVEFATATTSATAGNEGFYELTRDWAEGPYYTEWTHEGATRRESSRSVGTAGALHLGEEQIMLGALGNGVRSGYLGGLDVTAPGGMAVRVGSGAALVDGIVAHNRVATAGVFPAGDDLTVPANPGPGTRIDRVCIEVQRAGAPEQGRARPVLLLGTAGSGAPPTAAWTTTTAYLPLAQVTVAQGAAAIGSSSLTDERAYLLTGSGLVRNPVASDVNSASGNFASYGTFGDRFILPAAPVLLSGVVYDVLTEGQVGNTNSPGASGSMEVYGGSTATRGMTHAGGGANFYALVSSLFQTVTGTGAAYTCGMIVRKATGNDTSLTSSFSNGHLRVTASPRQ